MKRDLSSRTLYTVRMMGACAALLVASGLAAEAAQRAEPAATAVPEKFTYIVVLHDRAPKDGPSDVAEPDIPALGGEVLHQWHNRRVVRMPDAAVRALVAHRGVKYIQRVQSDGKLPGLPQSESVASTGAVEANWAPPTWFSGEYVYDGEGNITQIGTAASPSSDGGGDSYAYDSAGRLVSVVANHGTTHSEKYSYDSFGNLVNTERTAGPSTATPTFTASNRLQGVTYDNIGNVIATEGGAAEYIYDGMNMLRAKSTSTGVASYIYTADDERIGVQENGQTRWMIRDLEGRVLREWEGNSSWWLWVEDYVHRGGVLAAAEREPAEGGTRHFHVDHLGTARLLTDSNRAKIAVHDYFPFGVERTDFRQEMMERGTDRPEPMKFTGHERDFTAGTETDNRNQLDYMHARYYNPVWGRFLSVDPGADWDMYQPQSWNMYTYVRNNPVNATDPTGRQAVMEWTPFVPHVIGSFAAVYWLSRYSLAAQANMSVRPVPILVPTALSEHYAPPRKLPTSPETGNPVIDDGVVGPHTQLGKRTSKSTGETYVQGREFDENGKRVKDIDFTDHRRKDHENPHEHPYDPTTGERLPQQPLQPGVKPQPKPPQPKQPKPRADPDTATPCTSKTVC